jgi:hypothetical protein
VAKNLEYLEQQNKFREILSRPIKAGVAVYSVAEKQLSTLS